MPNWRLAVRIRGEITTSILLFAPSHGLTSLLPWEPTASVADLETAAVNSPRILRSEFPEFIGTALRAPFGVSAPDKARPLAGSAEVTRKNGHPRIKHLIIPTRVKADSFWGFQSGASQIPWWRTGG